MKTYTILIADDYPENLQIIVEALKGIEISYKIIKAVNGKILCALAEKRLPDLIITDWEMPEMDGIEAIKYLKALESTRDIPIIMCTGIMTTSKNLKTALESGATDYIRKPIDKIELQARVYSMIRLGESYRIIKEQNITQEQQKREIQINAENLQEVNNLLIERNNEIKQQNDEIQSQAKELERINIELEKLSIVASETDNAVTILDENFNIEWVNQGFSRLYGFLYDSISTLGKNLAGVSKYENIKKIIKFCKETKKSVIYENMLGIRDNKSIWVQTTITPIINNSGMIKKFVAIDSDITELKQAEETITQQNHELQELNATKDKLFSIIAHDLKSPFNSILGFSELLISKIDTSAKEKIKEFAFTINQSAKQTYELLENLLDWAKIQQGTFIPTILGCNLKDIAHSIFLLCNEMAKNKNITLINAINNDILISCDIDMTKTVLRNLITNAIKFTNAEGTVSIISKENKSQVEIEIRDTGVGIPPEKIPLLFKIKESISTKGTAQEKGSGLGLLLCKELVEKQNGKIWTESEIEKGTSFYFSIPFNLA